MSDVAIAEVAPVEVVAKYPCQGNICVFVDETVLPSCLYEPKLKSYIASLLIEVFINVPPVYPAPAVFVLLYI